MILEEIYAEDSYFAQLAKDQPDIFTKLVGKSFKDQNHGTGKIIQIDLRPTRSPIIVVKFREKTLFFRFCEISLNSIESSNDIPQICLPFVQWKKVVQLKKQILIEKNEIERKEKLEEKRKQRLEKERQTREDEEKLELERLQNLEDENKRTDAEEKRLQIIQQKITDLKNQFEKYFLSADYFYKNNCSEFISLEEYKAEKIAFVKSWVESYNSTKLDEEQALAISAFHANVQLVARAGSGKTTTLVNRAIFLQKHCSIPPNKILLLAFNRKAAEEISDRLVNAIGDVIPHVMTFHALAYAIVHPEESILFDDSEGKVQSLSSTLQRVIDDSLKVPAFYERIRAVMLEHFSKDWEKIARGRYEISQEEFLKFRRSLPRESMRGDFVKSFGEKVIADFLLEHNIAYKYERNHRWSGINYRPDFTIFKSDKSGVIIEYFGLEGEPDYDVMSEEKRKYWKKKENWNLVEFTPRDITSAGVDAFRERLKNSLVINEIPFRKLSEDEIWNIVRVRAVDRFTKATVNFIGRCRQLFISPADLGNMITQYENGCSIEMEFLSIARDIYVAYLDKIKNTDEEDFNGLMQRAVKAVEQGITEFKRKSGDGDFKELKYICIDEFQDFSELFFRLVSGICKANEKIELFCVGDDWQAINGFAGSDLKYFQEFSKYFAQSKKLYISSNYRSHHSIVNLGNEIMAGFGKPAISKKSINGGAFLVDLSEFAPTLVERKRHSGDEVTPALLRLIAKLINSGRSIFMLNRRNELSRYIDYKNHKYISGRGLESYLKLIQSYFPNNLHSKISISTTHKYKGLEKSAVIVLDAVVRSYPLMHPDWVFAQILGETPEKIIDENRRLFYVAITRGIEGLFIVTEKDEKTPFLDDIDIQPLNWEHYPPIKREINELVVTIANQTGKGSSPTVQIKELLLAQNYEYQGVGRKSWSRIYPLANFGIYVLQNEIWAKNADGVEVKICDDQNMELAKYFVNAGKWDCDFDTIATIQQQDEDII